MNLQDAIDQKKFIIEDRTLTDDDIQAMSIDELETLKMQITKKISGLSASLKEKQIDYANGGQGSSKEWYMSRRSALSINQRVLTYINSLIKKHRIRTSRTISDYFMVKAKAVLPRADFENILGEAQKEMKTGEGRHEGNNFNANT